MHSATPPPLVDPDAEGCPAERRRELQQQRLHELVDRLLAADGEQARRLRAAGVASGADVRLADLPKLPTVTRQDLSPDPWEWLAVSRDQVVCLHGSTGIRDAGDRPGLVPYTAADVAIWAEVMARALGGAGANRSSVVQVAHPYGLSADGQGVHHGAMRLGATVLPVSAGMTERQLRLLVELRPDVLCCTPSYAVHLGEALLAAGVDPARISLRVGLFGGEPWSVGLRERIEALLGVPALDVYGLAEIIGLGVAAESLDSGGLLNVAEDHFYVEAVDTEGNPVPDGTPGELVFTTLTKTGMPLLRYRSGDVATLAGPAEDSPRTLRRMSKPLGQRDDLLVLGGVSVFPSQIEAVLLDDERVSPHFLIVDDRGTPARAAVRLIVEPISTDIDPDALTTELTQRLRDRLAIDCPVRVVTPGSVPRTEIGTVRRLLRVGEGEDLAEPWRSLI